MTLTTQSERDTFVGGDEHFTSAARISMLFSPNGPRDFGAAHVSFEPGARTAWHSHPAGQTLVVTEGIGWVQIEGKPRREMKAGDVVWIPPRQPGSGRAAALRQRVPVSLPMRRGRAHEHE